MLVTNLTNGTIVFPNNYILHPAPATVTIPDAVYDAETDVADRVNAVEAAGNVSVSDYNGVFEFPRETHPSSGGGLSEEEVQALIDTAVTAAVGPLDTRIDALEAEATFSGAKFNIGNLSVDSLEYITFDTTVYDTDDYADGASPVEDIVIPTNGKYHVSFWLYDAGKHIDGVNLRRNRSGAFNEIVGTCGNDGSQGTVGGSTDLDCVAGDKLSLILLSSDTFDSGLGSITIRRIG